MILFHDPLSFLFISLSFFFSKNIPVLFFIFLFHFSSLILCKIMEAGRCLDVGL